MEQKKERFLVADFETSDNRKMENEELQAWVWLWCVMDCETQNYKTGRSIDDFFTYIFSIMQEDTILRVNFHNLKFDGTFILSWLIENGFEEKESLRSTNKYRTLIDADGNFFHITVMRNKCKVCFEDSLKKIPMSAEDIAESLDLADKKGVIDYSRMIFPEDEISQDDIDYCVNDCRIVAIALQEMLIKNGLTRLTASSNAFEHFKSLKHCNFRRRFPALSPVEDEFVRRSYRGGICECGNEKDYTGNIYCLDKNSMYPSMMYDKWLPIGQGEYFKGEYEYDECAPLYVARIIVTLKLKPNHFPTLANKAFFNNRQTFIESCVDEEFYLTNVDIETMFENYDVIDIDYIDGYKYQCCRGVFDSYIEYWYNLKQQAKKDGNKFNYVLAKIMQNSLYGRFGMRVELGKQKLTVDEKGVLKGHVETREIEGIYIPLASFVTSYARQDLIRNANNLGGKSTVLYMDTDSIHTTNADFEKYLDVDSYRLGAWKLEGIASRGIYIRQKTYAECIKDEWIIKCAGMSKRAKKNVSIEKFKQGEEFTGNLKQIRVRGGSMLVDHVYKIK